MNEQPTCETCIFFESEAKECRANPPTFSANTRGLLLYGTGFMFGGYVNGWPNTDKDKWCGMHTDKRDPNATGQDRVRQSQKAGCSRLSDNHPGYADDGSDLRDFGDQ
jgi:hypothetical protein